MVDHEVVVKRAAPLRRTGGPVRRTPLENSRAALGFDRPPPARSQPRRDWSEANAKLAAEDGMCRFAADSVLPQSHLGADGRPDPRTGCRGPVQRAHLIAREHDPPHPTREGWLIVPADHVIPLCEHHHLEYDAHRLNVVPVTTWAEQAAAVALVGLEAAMRRLMSSRVPAEELAGRSGRNG